MLWAIGTITGENKGTAKLASCEIMRRICFRIKSVTESLDSPYFRMKAY